jgi:type IV pilus assembly protein PilQ
MKKRFLCTLFAFMILMQANAQQVKNDSVRIHKIQKQLESLTATIPGLMKAVTFNVSKAELPNFVRLVANTHQINVSIDADLRTIMLTHNFSNALVKDIFLYLCKEHHLTIDFAGTILSFKQYKPIPPLQIPRNIPITYNKSSDLFSIDLKNDLLADVFKKITDVTGENLVFSPKIGNLKLSSYIKEKSFESAIDKLAFTNNLIVNKTKDNYYLFEENISLEGKRESQRPIRYRKTNFFFKIKDTISQTLDVDFENTPIADIINDIGLQLNINMFTSSPLTNAGKATFKANNIRFKTLLDELFKNTNYTYKEENAIYFFGERKQATQRHSEVIPLRYRSIEIMNEPMSGSKNAFSSNTSNTNFSTTNNSGQQNTNNNNNNSTTNQNYTNNRQNFTPRASPSFSGGQTKGEALLSVFPKEVTRNLEIMTDVEQNSFVVVGDAQRIKSFKSFIRSIDKPVPVILIEVMIIEVNKSATVNTGVEFGIGDAPVTTSGNLFPNANFNLGATTINKIIGGFKGFGSLNIGKVVPNFYAKIQAMETNGNIKIRSTPKLSTLNGHKATLSNGERSYYAVTQRNIYGSQNPQTSEIKNYVPIDADLSISIRPLVSGNGDITMSINVVQSSFNGKRIDAEAPPGVNSREFTSTIRVKDQDVIILGGLEENVKNESGSGVPFLARIPLIKYLFSKKTRTASNMKLSVLIKPTIIQ